MSRGADITAHLSDNFLSVEQVVVPSVITSGDTTDYQTFDLKVFTNAINIVPKFQRVDQWINIKEVMQDTLCRTRLFSYVCLC